MWLISLSLEQTLNWIFHLRQIHWPLLILIFSFFILKQGDKSRVINVALSFKIPQMLPFAAHLILPTPF